jgi:phage terminase small subunit
VRSLSERERRFIDAYLGEAGGNATRAARVAGYARTTAEHQASRLLGKVGVQRAIAVHQARREQQAVAAAVERDALLTSILRDRSNTANDRIKAITEMNRCDGRHSVRVRHGGGMTLEQIVADSRRLDT